MLMSKFEITNHRDYPALVLKIRTQERKSIANSYSKKIRLRLKQATESEAQLREMRKINTALEQQLKQLQSQLNGTTKRLSELKPMALANKTVRSAYTKAYKQGYESGYKARTNEYHPISRHPEFKRLMDKYACKDITGCNSKWTPCVTCKQKAIESVPNTELKTHKIPKTPKKVKQPKSKSKRKPPKCSQPVNEPVPYGFDTGTM